MNKIFSLIKVSLSHDMTILNIKTKKKSFFSKILLPLIILLYIMFVFGFYAERLIRVLKPVHLEFVMLTLFALGMSIITLIEGIYKSSSLLFNCKDDNLLLSLPIKRGTVLFIRILKFYIFELLYNSLFLLPAIGVYAYFVNPAWTFYLSSVLALLFLPIVPIILSCVIGFIVSYFSSRFKGKNVFETIFTVLFLLLVIFISYRMEGFVSNLAQKAMSLNDIITRVYYPVGAYISLITSFKWTTLVLFTLIHLVIFALTIFILGRMYFRVNSGAKRVLIKHNNKKYLIKKSSQGKALIKKEAKKFFLTPVFITNAGFGLVLFLIACVVGSLRFDSLISTILKENPEFNSNIIKSIIPLIMFGLVSFTAFLTSITSSMISLEGKSFNLLKTFPIKPIKIIYYKIVTALLIMVIPILLGDIFIFIKFKFDIISIVLILIASFLLPLVSEMIGIIINLKYPKMDATNDTEVVKQSMSSLVSTFIGLGLVALVIVLGVIMAIHKVSYNLIMLLFIIFFALVAGLLVLLLHKTCDKNFNDIMV